jgi:hypothetical protein
MEPSFRCNRAAHLQIEPNPATLTPPFNHRSVIPRTRLQYREVTQPGAHDDAIIAVKLGPSAGSLLPSSVASIATLADRHVVMFNTIYLLAGSLTSALQLFPQSSAGAGKFSLPRQRIESASAHACMAMEWLLASSQSHRSWADGWIADSVLSAPGPMFVRLLRSFTFSKASKRRVHSLSAGRRRPAGRRWRVVLWLYLPRLMIEEITEAQR